jgi:UTP--glucose-1-phosphate uridylyltransferase
MKISKVLITAAGRNQRTLPLQTLVDRDGVSRTALAIVLEEALAAGVEKIGVVVHPGDQAAYAAAAGGHAGRLEFVEQREPLGYGHAVWCGREFVGDSPFLLMVGDHVYVSALESGCARQLVEVAQREACSVSAVQATHESQLPFYGAIGGRRVPGQTGLYEVTEVLEKPTPTEAEQRLIVPGQRAGRYLCFFGMHVLTGTVMEVLGRNVALAKGGGGVHLSSSLREVASRERYLAFETAGRRYDIGAKYGLLTAQLALALAGRDREEVLSGLVEMLAQRSR